MTSMEQPIQHVKQLVVLSGKGGTGKTTLTAALIHLASQSKMRAVFADADVDAANLALVTNAKILETHPYQGGQQAFIHPDLCTSCGICDAVCRFDAIQEPKNPGEPYQVIELLCDGCAACVFACPEAAINMESVQDGEWFHAITDYGHQFSAELFPAAENTGKLVTTVKQNAKLFAEDHKIPLLIVDGPPGIGCPVISASAGADLALLVAEPGLSGIHDLKRIIQTLAHFQIPALICINKADLSIDSTQAIRNLANQQDIPIVGEIPFDPIVPKSMIQAMPVTRFAPQSEVSHAIHQIWKQIQTHLFKKGEDS